jgi:hypothetical protein
MVFAEVSCGVHAIHKSCGLAPRRILNETETELVEDFIVWMSMSKSEVIPFLPDSVSNQDFYDIIDQSIESEYFAIDDCTRGDSTYTVLAHANPFKDRVVIYSSTYFWTNYLRDYLAQSEETDNNICAPGSYDLWYARSKMFGVMCHENAHLIGIEDHSVVYDVGFACQDAAWDWYTTIDAEVCLE